MTKKAVFLLTIAVLLGGTYSYYFTDWVNKPVIQINKSNRPGRPGADEGTVVPVAFGLDGVYQLSSVRVVRLSALATNRNPLPLWHLTSKSNSIPVKGFYYGQRIKGMHPAKTNLVTRPLEPGVPYRLFIEAGRARGVVDFEAQLPAGAQ